MEIFSMEGWYFLLRWFHFLAGITWIGVLYYFNLIQTPFFGSELGGQARSAFQAETHGTLVRSARSANARAVSAISVSRPSARVIGCRP